MRPKTKQKSIKQHPISNIQPYLPPRPRGISDEIGRRDVFQRIATKKISIIKYKNCVGDVLDYVNDAMDGFVFF